MENAELTTMCMLRDPATGRVLVQNRRKNWKGIAFPGGHVEPGESFVACVQREMLEETGLTIGGLSLCGVKDWYYETDNKRYMVLLFIATQYEGTLKADSDEGEHFWTEPEALADMELASGFDDTLHAMFTPSVCELFYALREPDPWLANFLP